MAGRDGLEPPRVILEITVLPGKLTSHYLEPYGGTRIHNKKGRNLLLYPVELRRHIWSLDPDSN